MEANRVKQLEIALKESQDRLQVLSESLIDFLFILDSEKNILQTNSAVQNQFEFSAEELFYKNIIDLYLPDHRNAAARAFDDIIDGKILSISDLSMMTKSGKIIPVESKVGKGEWGEQEILFCLSRDELARRKAQEDLKESEERYRILTQNIADGVMLLQDNKLIFANDTLVRMFDFDDPSEIIGKDPILMIAHEFRNSYVRLCQGFMDGERSRETFQAKHVSNNGREFWAEGHHTVIQWQERKAVLVVVRDIHEAKIKEIAANDERERLHKENVRLRSTMKDRYKFGDIIGKSYPMQEIYELILSSSVSDASVLIHGESGTGKELVARTIHEMSPRCDRGFVPVNCGAIPEHLFESEFFGHLKGSFTGADRDKNGYFDAAHEGTLFLDEVAELNTNLQVKLLRALEGGEYTPVGANSPKIANFRIISATNRTLTDEIAKGALREDFFFRIHVVPIRLPSLRDRREDIPLLVESYLQKYSNGKKISIPMKVMETLYNYDWPGNVRELKNVLQRYMTVKNLNLSDLLGFQKDTMEQSSEILEEDVIDFTTAVKIYQKKMIVKALERNQWHKEKTARQLGIPKRTFFRKLSKLGLISA